MKPLIIMICILLTFSCATQRQHVRAVNGITEISFGKGGGFTGMTEQYILTGKAEVFKVMNGERTELSRINRQELRSLTQQIGDINFQDIKMAETGNMTYFIEVNAKKYSNRVTWTDLTEAPQLKELYKRLVNILKNQ
jgi:hypothetical protein